MPSPSRPHFPLPLIATLALFAGCGDGGSSDTPAAANAPEGAPVSPWPGTSSVLAEKLLELGVTARSGERLARELRTDDRLLPENAGPPVVVAGERRPEEPTVESEPSSGGAQQPEALDPELIALRDGLMGMVTGDARYLEVARQDVANLGEEIVPVLLDGLRGDFTQAEFKALADLAAAAPSAEMAERLLEITAGHEDAWTRRYAAWSIGPHAGADGADGVIPGLLHRLKYEKDTEALIWVAAALGAHENYAGLGLLRSVAGGGGPAAALAAGQLASLEATVGATASGDDPDPAEITDSGQAPLSLIEQWNLGSAGSTGPASDRLRGHVWLLVADMSGQHFQLRGVDDARYVLSRLGPWAASELGLALTDEDHYVRLHVAQVLERMGPRGQGAASALALSLHDPNDGVAGAAADALVSVDPDFAATALAARLGTDPSAELEVALVRALGRLESPPLERLEASFNGAEFRSDLRLAAAGGLLRSDRAAGALDWLMGEMVQPVGDPVGAESLLDDWLPTLTSERSEALGLGDPAALLEAWASHAPRASIIHTAEQAKERRRLRAELLRTTLDG